MALQVLILRNQDGTGGGAAYDAIFEYAAGNGSWSIWTSSGTPVVAQMNRYVRVVTYPGGTQASNYADYIDTQASSMGTINLTARASAYATVLAGSPTGRSLLRDAGHGSELWAGVGGSRRMALSTAESVYEADVSASAGGSVSAQGMLSFSGKQYLNPLAPKRAVTATPSGAGMVFSRWRYTDTGQTVASVPGLAVSGETIEFSPSWAQDVRVTAEFRSVFRTVNLSASGAAHAESVRLLVNGDLAAEQSGTVTVQEGDGITLSAAPAWDGVFGGWSVTGRSVNPPDAGEVAFTVAAGDAAVIDCVASFSQRAARTLTVEVVNPQMGAVSLSRDGGGVPLEGDPAAGVLSATVYEGVGYTLSAAVGDTSLHMFAGWSVGGAAVSAQLEWAFEAPAGDMAVTAEFGELPSFTLEARATDSWPYSPGNAAYLAGCRAEVERGPDHDNPDRWIGGNITVHADAAEGWRVTGGSIQDVQAGTNVPSPPGWAGESHTFLLSADTIFTFVFERVPVTVSCGAELFDVPPSLAGASVRNDATNVTGGVVAARHGDGLTFTATIDASLSGDLVFGRWELGDGTVLSSANPCTVTAGSDDITVKARFLARVSVSASHTAASDGSGTVSGGGMVLLGETAEIAAEDGADSIFQGWHDVSDTAFENPVAGLWSTAAVTVTKPVSLVARFVGAVDIEPRYLAVINRNYNTGAEEPGLGFIAVEETYSEEISESEFWGAFGGVPPLFAPPVPPVPGNRYFKFSGAKSCGIAASAGGALGFMRWRVRTSASAGGGVAWSGESTAGTSPQMQYASVNHAVLYTDWGVPVEVQVSAVYADGSDATMGTFTMLPATAARQVVQGGVSDRYEQGAAVSFEARPQNGYKFDGWFQGRDGTRLVSESPAFERKVESGETLHAKFSQDTDAIFRWEGSAENKMLAWRSRRYVAAMPLNLSSARVYADGYPVTLQVYTASSPDDPRANLAANMAVRDQRGFRLPMARPEKYVEVEVRADVAVTSVAVATSMGEIRGGGV